MVFNYTAHSLHFELRLSLDVLRFRQQCFSLPVATVNLPAYNPRTNPYSPLGLNRTTDLFIHSSHLRRV